MKMITNRKKIFPDNQSRLLFISGFALFCCFVISPLFGSLLYSWNVPFVFVYSVVIFCTNLLPLIIIAYSFQDIPPVTGILVIVLATGFFRMIADLVLSPVPFILVTTPGYLTTIVLYSVLLSLISVGVSLYTTRRSLSLLIILMGIVVYCIFIRNVFFTLTGLLFKG